MGLVELGVGVVVRVALMAARRWGGGVDVDKEMEGIVCQRVEICGRERKYSVCQGQDCQDGR